jgi:hypothetical protein
MTGRVLSDEQLDRRGVGPPRLRPARPRRIEQPYTWGNGFIVNLGLGADRDYRPAAARERVVPDRVLRQRRMRDTEQARLRVARH